MGLFYAKMKTHELYKRFQKSKGICTDSRKATKDSLFFALKGENFDGNKYAAQAISKGCAYAIADNPDVCDGQNIMYTENTLQALQDLANHHRRELNTPIIGITGSNGKTTTKELVHTVLSAKYKTLATEGNHNNHIGVPLTLLQIEKSHELAIVEMGANHPGEIAQLCQIAEPDLGIITNIGQAHLEGFGDLDTIARTKLALFDSVMQKNGQLFVNENQSKLIRHSLDYPNKTTYAGKNSQYKGQILQASPFLHIKAITADQTAIQVKTQMTGRYNLDNYLAAIAIGAYFGLSPGQIKKRLEAYRPANMRSQLVETGSNTLLMDAYNANPTSMEAALENLSNIKADKKTAILGDMLELGNTSPGHHRKIALKAMQAGLDQLFLIGDEFQKATEGLPDVEMNKMEVINFAGTNECIAYIKIHPISGSLILIKGSRRLKLERISEHV
jgi:UDP-N-acetylmuramoyl-tripeptide--D-alanyl-D-alanine ligase